MSYIDRQHKQTITYWGSPVSDGRGGSTFATPVTFQGRWTGRQEMFIDPQGEEHLSSAIVGVDREMDLGGYLYLGTSTETTPMTVDGAFQIRQRKKTTSMNGRRTRYRVWLV